MHSSSTFKPINQINDLTKIFHLWISPCISSRVAVVASKDFCEACSTAALLRREDRSITLEPWLIEFDSFEVKLEALVVELRLVVVERESFVAELESLTVKLELWATELER